jgi:hypothetical protein
MYPIYEMDNKIHVPDISKPPTSIGSVSTDVYKCLQMFTHL